MPQNQEENIKIKGAREHNLKNVSVEIPRNKFTIITGLSGSGKSSLAFDTLFAEGQRRYIESLSSYARQFLGKIAKPDVDEITGLPPAIAIEQRTMSRNPRSTVGTTTEVYEYLKLLYARVGKTFSPKTGKEIKKHTISDVVEFLLAQKENTKGTISFPFSEKNNIPLGMYVSNGFTRGIYKNEIIDLELIADESKFKQNNSLHILIDRIKIQHDSDSLSRFQESVEKAFNEGNGSCSIHLFFDEKVTQTLFSQRFEEDHDIFEEPHLHMFSFNSPAGACKKCEGYGSTIGIDPDLVIPDKSLSIYQDAVACWKGEVMSEWKMEVIESSIQTGFPIHTPYFDLTQNEKELLWNGNKHFKGIYAFFQHLEANLYKIQYRVMLSRYRGKTICPECKGSRIKKESSYVKINGKSIQELIHLPISDLAIYFSTLELNEQEKIIAQRPLIEIRNRLSYLNNVGLGYLTLNRGSNTLSGGETQRIMLSTQLGSGLVGSLYILDEPSIGLHASDTHKLIQVLLNLRDMDNTLVVVEHDEQIMKAADYIIDMGPEAGSRGGHIVFSGLTHELAQCENSITAKYLFKNDNKIISDSTRSWSHKITIQGANQHNLKNIQVSFPLNCLVVVSGVSGSGKSTLVRNILYPSLLRFFGESTDRPGEHKALTGDLKRLTGVELVDQNPIGRSTRSNPVTYIKVYDDIRTLFSQQALAKQFGFKPSYFSFNVEGGRCDECLGEGHIKIDMQFLADVTLVCDSCQGKRFKQEVLEVEYFGKSISDVLNMTIGDAIEFFKKGNSTLEKKIVEKLKILDQVGLDYLQMGQSSSFLSGGESQRLKLALYLTKEVSSPMLYIFDEPTTGLHSHDVKKLLQSFDALISRGHSIIVVEHNPDIIKNADWLIELGPEGGEKGGNLVFEGKPFQILQCESSPTGKFLSGNL